MGRTANKEDRIFVRNPLRHYRRTYARTDPYWGGAVFLGLVLLALWVAHKGRHGDPDLFVVDPALLKGEPPAAPRGPLPLGLAQEGWIEGKVFAFDGSNLYTKINGRETYYKSFGFKRLVFVSFDHPSSGASVDIELFDLQTPSNALGAAAGEAPDSATPQFVDGGLSVFDRNVFFVTRGSYYIRAIGSDEGAVTRAFLTHLGTVFRREIPSAPVPWSFALFVGALGLKPGSVSYVAENAFSFGFARDVHVATLEDGNTKLFVHLGADPRSAQALVERFTEGFRSYGESVPGPGVSWTKDRYIGSFSGARAKGSLVLGVQGAPSLDEAKQAMSRLVAQVTDAFVKNLQGHESD